MQTHFQTVWFVINALGGRVFSVGSNSKGEGVGKALVDVAIKKGNLSLKQAEEFWHLKKKAGPYIAEIW